MGQKVNPYGFRLGITTDWKSRWFEERNYGAYVVEDWKIRDFLMTQLETAAVSRIDIERNGKAVVALRLLAPGQSVAGWLQHQGAAGFARQSEADAERALASLRQEV